MGRSPVHALAREPVNNELAKILCSFGLVARGASDMSSLIEKMKESNFIKNGEVNLDLIHKLPVKKLVKFAEDSIILTSIDQKPENENFFSLSSSLPLSGGREGCCELTCRKNRLRNLSQFAALYSDKIYIKNYMSSYADNFHTTADFDEYEFKSDFADDIVLFNMISPLLRDGIIVPITPPTNYCPHCLAEKFIGKNKGELIDKETKRVSKELFDKITVSVYKEENFYHIHVKGLENITFHGEAVYFNDTPPPFLHNNPRLLAKLENGEAIELSTKNKKQSAVHEALSSELFESIVFELITAQCLKTSFLTDSTYQIDILNNISKPNISMKNKIIQNNISTLVPFANDIDIADLLKLRNREYESFIMFRKAMNDAITTCKNWNGSFTDQNAKEIYSDIIRPQLAKLDMKVKTAKKDLVKSSYRKGLAWTATISFGIYSGFIPSNLAAAATVLGFSKVAADFLETAMNKADSEDNIRNEDMYFLWKVRQLKK